LLDDFAGTLLAASLRTSCTSLSEERSRTCSEGTPLRRTEGHVKYVTDFEEKFTSRFLEFFFVFEDFLGLFRGFLPIKMGSCRANELISNRTRSVATEKKNPKYGKEDEYVM
jgi:hypothetical protein